jgi:peptidoglycan/xylan/chitin deacetylase (PgdA/CDA1 family)
MNELGNYLYIGSNLPEKPVVITFDDGFLDQLKAFELLKKYNMKATLYLIIGGERSGYCIGITRTDLRCGDDYMSWSQIKNLLNSGLIEIGAHTLNHADLTTLPIQNQLDEINESKKRLEDMYNVSVTTFAYPYGRYNNDSLESVSKAGFLTAVTTHSGTIQTTQTRLISPRVRNALLLP